MIAVDTNVLLRLVTVESDFLPAQERLLDPQDRHQYRQCRQLLEGVERDGQLIYVDEIVLVEMLWTLQAKYKRSRRDIVELLERMLANAVFCFFDPHEVNQALIAYRVGKADFSDYLISLRAQKAQCRVAHSFDKKAIREGLFVGL